MEQLDASRDTLEILNPSGHLTLTWSPSEPAEVAEIRAEVTRLKAAGYSFFLVDDTPADEVTAAGSTGQLKVRRIEDPTANPATEPVPASGGQEDEAPPPKAGRRSIAMRPLAGGVL